VSFRTANSSKKTAAGIGLISSMSLLDTGAFAENRYFDVFTEYAKASAEDILIKITAINRGPDEADLSLLPTIWFRTHGPGA